VSQSPNPHVTARRNLAQRIERLLRPQDGRPAPTLTDWQADQVLAAIEAAEEERFAVGERVMMKVERPDLWEPVGHLAVYTKVAEQLLKRLAEFLAT
jgi:hypothetical protein